ncbi:hypothetical protein KIW84_045898 [Lathyrus oleraceus]|uniref:Uncharacterized protein n=1 Tax=Pisum sativum TaxID=3888 RepID=A0A9D4XPB7_PEA|nr:hypothetical protein KIW84_045898 [Pisum sativum]
MKRAADRGHSKAQFEHELALYSDGDMIKALVYLELAGRAGEKGASHVKNSRISTKESSPLQSQPPVLELLKDFRSGKTVFRNIMSILLPGPLDIILSHDHNQTAALLEYVRYDFQPKVQQSSIKIMGTLSSRMVGLVQLLLKSNASNSLIEDYAACLEARPAPNITHLLLKFDLDTPVERTILQPKFHYSCMKVILDILEKLLKPDVNALLHEFSFQLFHELCTDPFTSVPTMDLLSNKRFRFFVKHLDTISIAQLPKRNNNQPLRISSLHQRAWLLKLLAVELHAGDIGSSNHRDACQTILSNLFGQGTTGIDGDQALYPFLQFLLLSESDNGCIDLPKIT